MKRIEIEFVDLASQRYPTLGDWLFKGDTLHIKASGPSEDEAFLVAFHELAEAWLCRRHGINGAVVDAWDIPLGDADADVEPGDIDGCPYRAEHRQAMLLEHLMANFLGVTDYGTIR